METKRDIEYFGSLIKSETLLTLDDKIMPNTFVLEAPEPFPGSAQYYHEHPANNKPLYVYLVLDKPYSPNAVTRATQNILRYFPIRFDAALGTIDIHNESFTMIRLRHFQSYDEIAELQEAFVGEGIMMQKAFRRPINGEGLIRLEKFFALRQMNDQILFDIKEPDHAYFHIARSLTWKNFEHLTLLVKSNWHKTNFDAAMGFFYFNFEVHDMIRIYDPTLNIADIEEIAKLYHDRIK